MSIGKNTVIVISIFFIFKCINYSWSNSQLHHLYKRDEEQYLVEQKCDDIYMQEEQCAFALKYCMNATPGIINYIQLYYCSPVKPLTLIFMCCWLLFLFGFVGVAASDFFCPNLQTIATVLHLSESLTGVTFLALGNGSPDLFSTFSAMQSNLGSLALGELIGAASFIVSIVAGSMCAIKPFRVKKFSFFRDVSFFTCAIILVMIIISDGFIQLYEAIILILFYIAYVLVVVGGNYYMKKRSNYLNLVERARLEYEDNGGDIDNLLRENFYNSSSNEDEMELYDEGFETEGYQDLSHQRNGLHLKLRVRTSLFSAIEFQDVVQSLKNTSSRFNSLNHFHRQRHRQHQQTYEPDEVSLHTTNSIRRDTSPTTSNHLNTSNKLDHFINKYFGTMCNIKSVKRQIRRHLFPNLIGFRQKSRFSQISSLLSVPVIFLLATTLPVVRESALDDNHIQLNDDTTSLLQNYYEEEDEEGDGGNGSEEEESLPWTKWLTAVQLIGAPLLIAFILVTQGICSAIIAIPLTILLGVSIATLFWLTTSKYRKPRLFWMMCFVGFGIAVLWIFLVANEVVSVLQAIGMALGISEAILGLTVFALGNSLGDFVANVTMAKMGYPLMAMSACFGGPMLNIMLGIGISATYVTSQRNEPYKINISKTIGVSSVGLLLILISSLILVPLNGYKMSRVFGYSWIAVYLICTIINLYIEIHT
ncbi:Sodium/calcium exchanger protein-domain-containing protein [Cokeromyces recurvatus]|uniref:Sodium/calcium exchanger protein-domain-containing protein n=1 Tax=Cokeromyces recurvatus TaxID=90255 RepID=UPI00221ED1EE|nr:Sodium/calcium exchanger protein-domain-containing protein [Cokeromyces recurvatus]KAI7904347.1 Sodium/calcium exchanger protein-domain-containing protein [Cokeromyces recurvatus]